MIGLWCKAYYESYALALERGSRLNTVENQILLKILGIYVIICFDLICAWLRAIFKVFTALDARLKIEFSLERLGGSGFADALRFKYFRAALICSELGQRYNSFCGG